MFAQRANLTRPRCRRLMGVSIKGTGSYVPEAIVTNEPLHARFGFDPDWIVRRTGILERRHALPHQATSDLCYHAALRCLGSSGIDPSDIDLIVLATFTPDMSFPSTACLLQDRWGPPAPPSRWRRPAPASCTP
jgi:3-oxoacyl-[acyl-carrier-protein] synthase-3